jgi:putative transposase
VKYGFIQDHRAEFRVRTMCRVLEVHPSGFYAWLKEPRSRRSREDQRQTGLIKQSWLESGCVYGYRKVHDDLRDLGEPCGKHRVHRLMRLAGLRAQVGYRNRRSYAGGKPAVVAENTLNRQFDPEQPNQAWVTDITMIRTYEGWLYLAIVVDLYSRQVVGWSMQSRMHADLVLKALMMAIWKRKPGPGLIIHSDQGSQYTGHEWQKFINDHGLVCSMSRRGNCHDNAVAESFFQLLKRERIKRKIYATRDEARADVFDYIELFYNTRRRHGSNDGLPPVKYEQQNTKRLKSV